MTFLHKLAQRLARLKVALLIGLLATLACERPVTAVLNTALRVASINVSPAVASVPVGRAVQLIATPRDSTGVPLTGRALTWLSSNLNVAAVDGGGLVTAQTPGAATIAAVSEGVTGTAAVTVTNIPVASVTVTPATRDGQAGPAAVTVTGPPLPPPGGVIFQSDWTSGTGNTSQVVTDGNRWAHWFEFNSGGLLSVVAGGPSGYANALRVQQRGPAYSAVVTKETFVPQSTDFYLRYYMRNDDTSPVGDHIVTADIYNYSWLTYMRKSGAGAGWSFVMLLPGGGYPLLDWGPTVTLARGAWYRFEYFVHFTDATHMQVHPRVYDAAGTLLASDADFQQQDYASAVRNGRSNWTLASY